MMHRVVVGLTTLLTLGLSGCVSRTTTMERTPDGRGMGPSLVVERFLQAANARDIETLGRLFGTAQGPLTRRDPPGEVDERMMALASLLQHRDYAITGERMVPGRRAEAITILTRLQVGERQVDVPFTLVRADESWLVEQIGVEDLGRW